MVTLYAAFLCCFVWISIKFNTVSQLRTFKLYLLHHENRALSFSNLSHSHLQHFLLLSRELPVLKVTGDVLNKKMLQGPIAGSRVYNPCCLLKSLKYVIIQSMLQWNSYHKYLPCNSNRMTLLKQYTSTILHC